MSRRWCLLFALILTACAPTVEPAWPAAVKVATPSPVWPDWNPVGFSNLVDPYDPLIPNHHLLPEGEISTYGPLPDGTEHFAVVSKREFNAKPGIFQFRLCFLPTSIFAGPSPLETHLNRLRHTDKAWIYPAYDFRSTFFNLYPSTAPQSKGLIVYHTSIMLLSIVEKDMIKRLSKKGWNIMVALPPDSLFRTKVPAMTSSKGTLRAAAELIAEDMDRHYAEQAFTTRAALAYLRKTRPDWLSQKRVLMGTSAGTFGLPAEALMNPDWDSIVIVSGGTNLLSTFASGSANVFNDTLDWLADARKDPPPQVTRIPTDQEYLKLYEQAASMTKLHAGALASQLRDQRILMISGSLDQILPKSQLEDYYNALGRPERWTYPLGHHLIAVKLAFEANRLDRWLSTP